MKPQYQITIGAEGADDGDRLTLALQKANKAVLTGGVKIGTTTDIHATTVDDTAAGVSSLVQFTVAEDKRVVESEVTEPESGREAILPDSEPDPEKVVHSGVRLKGVEDGDRQDIEEIGRASTIMLRPSQIQPAVSVVIENKPVTANILPAVLQNSADPITPTNPPTKLQKSLRAIREWWAQTPPITDIHGWYTRETGATISLAIAVVVGATVTVAMYANPTSGKSSSTPIVVPTAVTPAINTSTPVAPIPTTTSTVANTSPVSHSPSASSSAEK